MQFDREYFEKVSGKDMNRPELQALLSNVRKGDEVYVHDMSRLGRNTKDLLEIVEKIVNEGASIRFHKENLEFKDSEDNPFHSQMLNLFSSLAQFERDLLLQRQREEIAIAKAKGKYKRKKVKVL